MTEPFTPKQIYIAGIPLTTNIGLVGAVQRQQAAPRLDSAPDFEPQILAESQNELKNSTAGVSDQLASPDDIMTTGPSEGAPGFFKWLQNLGAYETEAERASAQEAYIAAAKAHEERIRAGVERRARIRNQTRELNAQLGFPDGLGNTTAEREAAIAFDRQRLENAEQERNERSVGPSLDRRWWGHAVHTGLRETARMGLKTAEAPFAVADALNDLTGEKPALSPEAARAWLDGIEKDLEEALPGDKARAREFTTQVIAGGGSFLAYLIAGLVTGGTGAVAMGAASMGTLAMEDAETHDATAVQRLIAFTGGAGMGVTEAIPIMRMLMRAETMTGGAVTRALRTTAAGSMEEFLQEFGQSAGQDIMAKAVYDPDRELDFVEWGKQGLIGSIVGGAAGGGLSLVGDAAGAARQAGGDTPAAPSEDEIKAFAEAMIRQQDELQDAFEGIVSPGELAPPVSEPGVAGDEAAAPRPRAAPAFVSGAEETIAQATEAVRQLRNAGVGVTFEELAANLDTDAIAEVAGRIIQTAEDGTVAVDRKAAEQVLNEYGLDGTQIMQTVMPYPGGTMPATRDDGMVELVHWARGQRNEIDPDKQGTGPLRGEERNRLAGVDDVNRAYYGAEAAADFKPTKEKPFRQIGDGYLKEGGLGPIRHVVAVDPNELYNMSEDPLGFREQLPEGAPSSERLTEYERLIKKAGFKGAYLPNAGTGKAVEMFVPLVPESIIDDNTGRVLSGKPSAAGAPTRPLKRPKRATAADFQNWARDMEEFPEHPYQTLERGGWAVITAIQESQGAHNSDFNREQLAKMEKELQGSETIPIEGSYRGVPQGRSWIVLMTEAQALKMAQRYNQESILTNRGLVFTDGRVVDAVPSQTMVGQVAADGDFYSVMPDGTAWTLGLDMDQLDSLAEGMVAPELSNESDMISTRFPSQKQSTDDPTTDRLVIGVPAMKQAPAAFEHNTNLVRNYPNWKRGERMRNPDKVAEAFKAHVKENLTWLYNQVDPAVRERTRLWYEGARMLTQRWAERYRMPPRAVAAIIASLSPQNPWQNNITMTERILDMLYYHADTDWTAQMTTYVNERLTPAAQEMMAEIGGRSLRALVDQDADVNLKALWLRAYDAAHFPPTVFDITPEGDFTGMAIGTRSWFATGSVISKIFKILDDPSTGNINMIMGDRHKIRNFYNNIIAPNSDESITIDTHAVGAALMRPLSSSSWEVMHALGTSPSGPELVEAKKNGWVPAKSAGISGASGTYGLYADAYREAAAELGILPRELQSITWEAIRSLYGATEKRTTPRAFGQGDLFGEVEGPVQTARRLWKDYRNGEGSANDVREAILREAGGIPLPGWALTDAAADIAERARGISGAAVDARTRQASYPRRVPGDRVSRGAAGPVDARARGDTAEAVPQDVEGQVTPDTEAFQLWFGDSKVVDENGKPLVVYHGTGRQFTVFNPQEGLTEGGGSLADRGVKANFFTSSRQVAEGFAEGAAVGEDAQERVVPAYLSIQRPYVIYANGESWAKFEDEIVAALNEPNHDGVILYRVEDGMFEGDISDVYIVPNSTQIKSAETNRGTFDPNDPDIEAQPTRNRGEFRAEQKRPTRGIPEGQGPDAELSMRKIVDNFQRLMNLTIRQGRLTLKGNAVGQYSRKTQVIRSKNRYDLSTIVHEGGHYLNDDRGPAINAFVQQYKGVFRKVAHELYGGELKSEQMELREGFAEFFRIYVLNRTHAELHYGNITHGFDALLRQEDPTLHAGLEAIRQQYELALVQSSVSASRSIMVEDTTNSGINGAMAEMKEQGVVTWFQEKAARALAATTNKYKPLNRIVAESLNRYEQNTGRALDLKAAEDARILARLARNSGNRAMIELTDGVVPYHGLRSATRGLREAYLLSQGYGPNEQPGEIDSQRERDFDTFLMLLRAEAEYRRRDAGKLFRPPVSLSRGDVKQALRDMRDKYGDSFMQAAAIVDQYGRALWRKQYEAGLMTREIFMAGLDKDFYAPLQRDMSDRQGPRGLGNSVLTRGEQSILRKFRGSDRNIISPMQALMHKTFAIEAAIAENEVKKALAAMADKIQGTGSLIERIPAKQAVGTQVNALEVARLLANDPTLDETDAADMLAIVSQSMDPDRFITLFRQETAAAAGENIMFFWEDGKLQAIQVADGEIGRDVVDLLTGVGRESLPILADLVAGTSAIFRSAITSWPDFLLVNFVRDQMSAWMLTDVGFKPFYSGLKGVLNEVQQTQVAKDYNASAGIFGGASVAAVDEARVRRDLRAVSRGKGYLAKTFGNRGFFGAAQGIAKLSGLTETGTRLGLYQLAFERGKADGLTDYEAAVEAAYIATDYIDFGLNGNQMLLLRRTIPFLNAQIQGLYKMMRTLGADEVAQRKGLRFALTAYFKNAEGLNLSRRERDAVRTGRKLWLKMGILGLIGAAITAAFKDDEDYQETSEYLRATGWVIPLKSLGYPGEVAYIPKPFELAIVSNFMERGVEFAYGDNEALNRLKRGAALSLSPPMAPPVIKTAVELRANYDFFSGRQITPEWMQAYEPYLRYNAYTSDLAKWAGRTFNLSPVVVDHVLEGLGASAYRDVRTMTNMLNKDRPTTGATDWPITRRFLRDARRGATTSHDFWAVASQTDGEMTRAGRTYRRELDSGNELGAQRFLNTLPPDHQAWALLDAHFEADEKRLHPIYRTRQTTRIFSAIRREMLTPLGVENTSEGAAESDNMFLSPEEKQEVDNLLSELARREMRNALVFMQVPGWTGKARLDTVPTVRMLQQLRPDVAEELQRRITKAKVYPADFVEENWPDIRSRLLYEQADAILTDVTKFGQTSAKFDDYGTSYGE